ncbi:phosphoenolpyruvate synthase [Qipengyuania sp. DY56-A-20]|uniref:Phosphoenolpyruvate synthase n=1 Tax=Qipengyuania benthica TaxID=3067651 RepID=A0ABT9H9N4_9SPHN|nr:phosphoenolpyruvate synthase [Qipengyuania sp. DY56-A-20]MDP4539981.1 phosphoenolpyruvate synthase [Qipengyuania sp. DY56-A-20]
MNETELVLQLAELNRQDGDRVGGKNASLGEMIGNLRDSGIRVPGGFATTAAAYWRYVEANGLEKPIAEQIGQLKDDLSNLHQVGEAIRRKIREGGFPPDLEEAIRSSYRAMGEKGPAKVAVRSSATAEDLPEASFAGQLETFLNVEGESALLDACRNCYASLFTDRAISYRENHGFDHLDIALSVGVQRMVRSDLASSGVMFSIDTETGFPRSVLITGAWGLGETVVQGMVDPDEFQVFKPLLDRPEFKPIIEKKVGAKSQKMVYGNKAATELVETAPEERRRLVIDDDEVLTLARWATIIERHYGLPMDMEWAKDGETNELFIVQARPETVQSRREAGQLRSYSLKKKGKVLVSGVAIGDAIATGPVIRLDSPDEIERFETGAILVTGMTDPDWVPIMKKAAAIVTDHGGRTSHAAIVSRELGLSAIVGTGDATKTFENGQAVTVSCAEGDEGRVYEGALEFEVTDIDLSEIPETRTKAMVNLANPASAFRWWRLPSDGVGLARMEFVISNHIKVHPMALVRFDEVEDEDDRKQIEELTRGFETKTDFFVDTLARGIARIAAAHHPNPVIVRMSDFKTNEYADLLGGEAFEPKEENPMLGWRGASRYYHPDYREGFALECLAIRRAREEIGLDNIVMMIPFCRTPQEADRVLEEMAKHGLMRGKAGLEVYVMAELPSNVLLADKFATRFDGFSIGSNDLTQLTLGIDRDSDRLSSLFDERNEAVTKTIAELLAAAKRTGTHTGICGQAPSDHPEFARFLVEHGIDSISVTPDSFLRVKQQIAMAEAALAGERT